MHPPPEYQPIAAAAAAVPAAPLAPRTQTPPANLTVVEACRASSPPQPQTADHQTTPDDRHRKRRMAERAEEKASGLMAKGKVAKKEKRKIQKNRKAALTGAKNGKVRQPPPPPCVDYRQHHDRRRRRRRRHDQAKETGRSCPRPFRIIHTRAIKYKTGTHTQSATTTQRTCTADFVDVIPAEGSMSCARRRCARRRKVPYYMHELIGRRTRGAVERLGKGGCESGRGGGIVGVRKTEQWR